MNSVGRRGSVVLNSFINISEYDLTKEADRRKSFIDNGYPNTCISVEDLALAGFYFFKRPDKVKCAFCHLALEGFETGDTAIGEHMKFSPNCPLLAKRRSTGNIPIDEIVFRQRMPSISSYDEVGPVKTRKLSKEHKYPEYGLPQSRLNSFETWPIGIKQKPHELAAAGFFYSGQSDMVICFSCGLYLNQWESNDNPWVEHKKWLTKECNYLNLNQDTVMEEVRKYDEFKKLEAIEKNIKSLKINKAAAEKDGTETQKETDLENVCKICLDRKSQIIFLPCRHVAVCGSCVFGIGDKCPICRTEIKEKFNIFYS